MNGLEKEESFCKKGIPPAKKRRKLHHEQKEKEKTSKEKEKWEKKKFFGGGKNSGSRFDAKKKKKGGGGKNFLIYRKGLKKKQKKNGPGKKPREVKSAPNFEHLQVFFPRQNMVRKKGKARAAPKWGRPNLGLKYRAKKGRYTAKKSRPAKIGRGKNNRNFPRSRRGDQQLKTPSQKD